MTCELEIILEFPDEETARKILDSVSQDNEQWISARLESKRIICSASSDSIGGILHTAEDFISCVVLAEKMLGKK